MIDAMYFAPRLTCFASDELLLYTVYKKGAFCQMFGMRLLSAGISLSNLARPEDCREVVSA